MALKEIKASDISKSFDSRGLKTKVLDSITARFSSKSSYSIVGASGSGKSTLLSILSGLESPSTGDVYYDGAALTSLTSKQREALFSSEIGFIFQFHYLIGELSLLENVMLPGLIARKSTDFCKKRALRLLEYVELDAKRDQNPLTLSGGEQQRASLVRALFNQPSFIFADEPTGSLDAHMAQNVLALLIKAKEEFGAGLIICSHDEKIYEKMEKVMLLENGRLIAKSGKLS